MEGTLFRKAVPITATRVAPSAWVALAVKLGQDACDAEDRTQERWLRGEYPSYLDWMQDTITIHKEYRLTEQIFQDTLDEIEFMPGVERLFEVLRTHGVHTALITGGFKYQADRATRLLRIDHSLAACEYFWDNEGKLEHWNLLPGDFNGKEHFMDLISAEYGYSREQCAFVGDGPNDCGLAKKVGKSIAFNGSDELQKVSTYVLNQPSGKEDLSEVLPYLGFEK